MLRIYTSTALVLMTFIVFSGCGSGQYVLLKNGQPAQESALNKDRFVCKQQAAQAYPFAQRAQIVNNPQPANTGNYSTNCNPAGGTSGGFICTTTSNSQSNNPYAIGYAPSYDQQLLASMQGPDANLENRIQFYNECMAALGYKEVYVVAQVSNPSSARDKSPTGANYYNSGITAFNNGNYDEAVRLYRMAAERGVPEAQYNLARMYDQGKGVRQDNMEALRLYRQAAEHDLPGAYNALGIAYAKGFGTPVDYVEAEKWYRKAAEKGDAQAKNNLEILAAQRAKFIDDKPSWLGQPITPQGQESTNPEPLAMRPLLALPGHDSINSQPTVSADASMLDQHAARKLRIAADLGSAEAQAKVGRMYETGQGAKKSIKQALELYWAAAIQGYQPAIDALSAMDRRAYKLGDMSGEYWSAKIAEVNNCGTPRSITLKSQAYIRGNLKGLYQVACDSGVVEVTCQISGKVLIDRWPHVYEDNDYKHLVPACWKGISKP